MAEREQRHQYAGNPRRNAWTITGCLVALGVGLWASLSYAAPVSPEQVEGLLAWYDARSLYEQSSGLRDGELVRAWRDASGNGHDLTDDGQGVPALFRTLRIGDRPAVKLQRATAFLVSDPFQLRDHTIFLVYRTKSPIRALFSSANDAQLGVLLAYDGQHQIRHGLKNWGYGTTGQVETFSITVLAREADVLSSFVNGADVSAGDRSDLILEVGRLFRLDLNAAATRDAEGMVVAELIFYGRRLTSAELRSVSVYLADKYGMELEETVPVASEPQATVFDWEHAKGLTRLPAAKVDDNLNGEGTPLTWSAPAELVAPFRYDAKAEPTRLYCTKDDSRVQLSVRLQLSASTPGTGLRILVLKNGQEYLGREGSTEPAADDTTGTRLSARFDTSVTMNAGEYVEIVAARDAAEGAVHVSPEGSVLLATVK